MTLCIGNTRSCFHSNFQINNHLTCCREDLDIHDFPSLEDLDVDSTTSLTDGALAQMTTLSQLRSLVLTRCDCLSDSGFRHISALTTLRKLDLSVNMVCLITSFDHHAQS